MNPPTVLSLFYYFVAYLPHCGYVLLKSNWDCVGLP